MIVENHVTHEADFSTPVSRQIEARRAGRRKNVRHGGTLCSTCLTRPPRPGQGNCAPCHAEDAKARRRASRARSEGVTHG